MTEPTPKEINKALAKEVEAYLREKYPKCFNDDYLPLKIGVFHEIVANEQHYTKSQIRKGIRLYVGHKGYQEKILQAGHLRYDLAGEVCGEVTEQQVKNILNLKEESKLKRKEKKKEKKRQKKLEAEKAKQAEQAKAKQEKKKSTEEKPKTPKKAQKPASEKNATKKAVKPVEPVVKVKREVKIDLSEQRAEKSVPAMGKKKLSLKKSK